MFWERNSGQFTTRIVIARLITHGFREKIRFREQRAETWKRSSLLRMTRGARAILISTLPLRMPGMYLASLCLDLRMNGMPRTQSENVRLDPLSLGI